MSYSQLKPFENREHIVWEIGFCSKMGMFFTNLSVVFVTLGVVGVLLNMKLGLGSIMWLLLTITFSAGSVVSHLHLTMAKHLLGMEVIKKE
jgi:hypothetical protein